MLKKVLIIHPEGNSVNNPTMKCMIDLLCDHYVDVHILHRKAVAPMPSYRGVKYHPWGRLWGKIKNIVMNGSYLELPRLIVFYVESIFLSRDYDLIIGVDREGLIQASFLSRLLKTPYAFISFEIMFEEETSALFKKIERNAAKLVSRWFVQDSERAGILEVENHLDPSRVTKIPLASKDAGRVSSRRLRDDLGICKSVKVAILMGSISEWTMSPNILRSVVNWPNDWRLIVHARYGHTAEHINNLTSGIFSAIEEKVFISEATANLVDDMSYVLSGVDVGLAFYKPEHSSRYTGKNLKHLGLASGKISTCLRYGIPVIMNQVGLYADLVQKYRFGLSISSASELPEALCQVCQEDFAAAAREFFLSHLDFAIYEDQVWDDLNSAVIVP